jgi:hypothetical protein
MILNNNPPFRLPVVCLDARSVIPVKLNRNTILSFELFGTAMYKRGEAKSYDQSHDQNY